MRSRTVRLATGAIALVAIAAAAFFLVRSEQQIGDSRVAVYAFDLHAREATDALADLRFAQQAYVAGGQGVAFWMPKVAATLDRVHQAVGSLSASAASAAAKSSLDEAALAIEEFGNIDKRARDYLKGGQLLMAADVIFTEGGGAAATAGRHVESARLAERQALDRSEAAFRKREAAALGAAAGLIVLVVLTLALTREKQTAAAPQPFAAPAAPQPPVSSRAVALLLRNAADVCTDFGRARDQDDLQKLMVRAADLIDASGLVVWLGSVSGAELRPMLAHGYPPQAVAQMPLVRRADDNAAAAAYRTGQLQIVMERPGTSSGAIVAPILSTEGCIGALSAEVRSGGEASETVQALAAIFAAQLATVVGALPAPSAAADAADANGQRAAANS